MIPIGFFFGGGKRTDQTAGHKEGIGGSMTIAWDDQFKRQNIMWKVPRNVRMNDNVVVREDEIAVFYRDGKVLAYLDRPDRYALTSQNAPILGRLIQALSGVVQQAEVYYLQKRIFDGKFGTQDAFLFQDPDFDMVQLRAFGDFRYRLKDPETFINQFVGT
ncbi:MAG: SPFH domain-containing protein, partial [Methanobacteriota archaeon]